MKFFLNGKFYNNYKLVFCGTGELEEEIKQKVEKLKLSEKVIFLGWQENVYKWMKNSKLLVCTSDNEGFPMNLIEAMACGTKIVSSNCKFGPNEILLGKYAKYLVKTDDIDDYIEKINDAIKNYPHEKNEILEKCDVNNVVNEYEKFMIENRE